VRTGAVACSTRAITRLVRSCSRVNIAGCIDVAVRSVKRFLDGAGVLATSVRLVNERALNKADLVAITHPDVHETAPPYTHTHTRTHTRTHTHCRPTPPLPRPTEIQYAASRGSTCGGFGPRGEAAIVRRRRRRRVVRASHATCSRCLGYTNVRQVGEDQRAVLRKAGYVIHERSVPVTSADIAPGALKEARQRAHTLMRALAHARTHARTTNASHAPRVQHTRCQARPLAVPTPPVPVATCLQQTT
jgi:hypothetical protein